MRKFFGLLNLILCFELVVSPLAPSLSLLGDKAYAESCAAGFTYDATLNRCLTKTETANVLNATAACNGDVECYKRNAQDAFQKEVSQGKAPERAKELGLVSTVANIAAVAGPVTVAVAGMGATKSKCQSASFWTMIGGSVALFVGDNLANFQHKKRLKEIKDEWGKIVNPTQAEGDKDLEKEISMEAQSQSFEMLARSEESLAKAAKMKKTFFMVAALAYAASGVISGIEIIAENNPATGAAAKIANFCPAAPANAAPAPAMPVEAGAVFVDSGIRKTESLFTAFSEGRKNFQLDHIFYHNLEQSTDMVSFFVNKRAMDEVYSSPSLDVYHAVQDSFAGVEIDHDTFSTLKEFSLIVIKNINPLPSAVAEVNSNASKSYKEMEAKGSNPLLSLGAGAAIGAVAGKVVGAKLVTPTTRAIFSGVMAGMATVMAMHAGKQAEASTKRAELLRKMRDEFKSAAGAINSCKSEDRSNPAKPECYCYTAENEKNQNRGNSKVCTDLWGGINTASGSYAKGSSPSSGSKICVNNQNQADAACACKQSNTCMKVNLSGLKGVQAGTFSVLSQAVDPINKFANGSLDAAAVDTSGMASLAAKLNKAKSQMENSKALAGLKKIKKKEEDKLKSDLTVASSRLPSSSHMGSNSSSFMPTSPGEAATMLEKELEASPITTVGGGSGMAPNDPAADSGEGFALDLSGSGGQNENTIDKESQLAEVMGQNLDYGGSDINADNANLFEVLSNRYQRSGMKRLFDKKEEPAPEKAAKTEVIK